MPWYWYHTWQSTACSTSTYLLICGRAVRLPHIFPLDLAVLLLLLLTLEQGLEGSLHQSLPKEMSSIRKSQEPEYRHYQQMSSLHLL